MTVFCPEPVLIKTLQTASANEALGVIALIGQFLQLLCVDGLDISDKMSRAFPVRIYPAFCLRDQNSRIGQKSFLDRLSGLVPLCICVWLVQLLLGHLLQRYKTVCLYPGGVQAGINRIFRDPQDLADGLDLFLGLYLHFPRHQAYGLYRSLSRQKILISVVNASSFCFKSGHAYPIRFSQ